MKRPRHLQGSPATQPRVELSHVGAVLVFGPQNNPIHRAEPARSRSPLVVVSNGMDPANLSVVNTNEGDYEIVIRASRAHARAPVGSWAQRFVIDRSGPHYGRGATVLVLGR